MTSAGPDTFRGQRLRLENEQLIVEVTPGRGAEILTILDRRTGVDVLFRTPWSERALATLQGGSMLWHATSRAAWLESYAGGWQVLCPNAAGPHIRAGVEQGFHGESAVIAWRVDSVQESEATLNAQLFTAPLQLRRRIMLAGSAVSVVDEVTNEAKVSVEFDYQHHPAFGAPLVAPECLVETGAAAFVADASSTGPFAPAVSYAWPASSPDGSVYLDRMPPAGEPRAVLGWLTGFDQSGWVALRNPQLDLAAVLAWDATVMPHAWIWQNLHALSGFPWFGRGYCMAIEPSTAAQSGALREQAACLAPGERRVFAVRLALTQGCEPITNSHLSTHWQT